jgi:hypothetical protein
MDTKYSCTENFHLDDLIDGQARVLVKDVNCSGCGVYQAVLASEPGDDLMWKCIQQIVYNVENKLMGDGPLDITGPTMMKRHVCNGTIVNLNYQLVSNDHGDQCGIWSGMHNRFVLVPYPHHRQDRHGIHYSAQYAQGKDYVFR